MLQSIKQIKEKYGRVSFFKQKYLVLLKSFLIAAKKYQKLKCRHLINDSHECVSETIKP